MKFTGKGNKKGSVQDAFYIGVVLLFFGVLILLAFWLNSNIDSHLQSMDNIPNEAKQVSATMNGYFPGVIDNMFIVVFVFLSIGALALAAMVRVHPIFMVLFVVAWLFMLLFGAVMSNIYQEMAGSADLIAYADKLPMITYGMTYLPILIGILGILIMIVMYKARQNDIMF